MIYSIYIINRSGGVIFKQDSEHGRAQDDANDGIRMGSLFYAFNSMAQDFSPVLQTGQLIAMESDNFSLKCLYTDSGTTFFALGDPNESNLDLFLQQVYELYCSFALKNPYWEYDQPVHNACEKFVLSVERLINNHNSGNPYNR
jgi:hypothetical protein